MPFYKTLSVGMLIVVSLSLFAQDEPMSAKEAIAIAKSKGWLSGITKEGEMKKTEVYRDELEETTGKQGEAIVTNTSQAYFKSLRNNDNPQLPLGQDPNYKPDESQVEIDLDIFVSLSMPKSALKKALAKASKIGARILIQGVDAETSSILPVLRSLKALSKDITPEPLVQIDPVKYKKYNIKSVPTMIYRSGGSEYTVKGLIAPDWLIARSKDREESENFGVMGAIFPVEEINIIDLAEQRNAAIDWDKKKQEAIDRFWKIKPFEILPEVEKSKVFFLDPTINVTKDIVDLNGNVIAHKGTTVNPAANMPYQLKLIVFDALKPTQVEWALHKMEEWKGHKVVIVSTRFDRENGWKNIGDIRKRFGREIKLLNKAMVSTFGLVSSPAVIETQDGYIKISQIGKQELDELMTQIETQGE